MSEAKVDLTVQGGQAESAWQRYASAVEAVLAVDRKRADEDKKASQAAAEYGRVKSRVLGELETATGRYGRKLGELERLSAAGDISAEQFSQGLKKIQTELDGSNPALAEAAQKQRELARSAQQVLQAIQTPFEGYRQRVAGLKEQLQAGLLTQEQYSRAIRQSREELVKGSAKVDERKRKEQELATQQKQVIESITTPQERYNRQLGMLSTLRQKNKLDENQYARAVAHSKTQLEQATQQQHSSAAMAALNLAKFTAAAVGVGSVLGGISLAARLLRAEYDNLVQRQKTAADRQIDVAQAQRAALQNIGGDPELANGKASELVAGISAKTGASQTDLWKSFSAAASFKGDLSNKQALDVIGSAAELDPTNGEAIQKNTVAAMALIKRDKTVTPAQAMGFILSAKVASPVIENAVFAEHVVPNITSGQAWGNTARESAALNAAIGQSINDTEGRVTATATTQLSKQLAEVLPNVAGGTTGRLAAMQLPENEKIKRRLLGVFGENFKKAKGDAGGEITAEAKAFTTIIELLKGEGRAGELYKNAYASIPEIHAAAPAFGEMINRLNKEPLQKNLLLKRTLESGVTGMQLSDIQGAQGSIAREGLQQALAAAGVSKIGQDVAGIAFEASTVGGQDAPVKELQKQLRQKSHSLSQDQIAVSGGLAYGEGMSGDAHEAVPTTDPNRRRASQELATLADALNRFVDHQEKQGDKANRLAEEGNNELKKIANPAARANTKPPGPRPAAAGQRP
ncbi:MAG: hypothetical protein A3E01_10770 [Gammaproteobacteria bacterium RIFCSPHIGHO2_12_FULL_63_22]|nr:MAG: hypothetical protein A3E01_10770 [Gammaproteobacteria bacterium RIFCSPHIGHO2_12_FULL_63_22]